jgi:hypothetical protein
MPRPPRRIPSLILAATLAPAMASASGDGDRLEFHALAPSAAKSASAGAVEQVPPPILTGLAATVDAEGRLSYTCRAADNPAYRAYRERVEAATRAQEPR